MYSPQLLLLNTVPTSIEENSQREIFLLIFCPQRKKRTDEKEKGMKNTTQGYFGIPNKRNRGGRVIGRPGKYISLNLNKKETTICEILPHK